MRAYMGHMGAAIGHACAHIWPYMGAHIGHMGAAMGHVCAHTWAIYGSSPIGRAGRKGIVGNPFPSLVIPAPSLPLPSLFRSVTTRSTFKIFGIINVVKPAIILLKLVYPINRYIRFLAFLRPILNDK